MTSTGPLLPGTTFGARLGSALAEHGPLCAGLDPHAALLADWGLPDSAAGLARFAAACLEAFAGQVAVVKPQSAFFERHGARGVAVLEDVLAGLRGTGTLALLDVKRGDIGSTVQAYADAYVDPRSTLCADAVTASPYLGLGSLDPLLATAARHGRGVFVLALTSNPEGAQVQRARTPDGGTVAGAVLAGVRAANAAARPPGEPAEHGPGSVGVVVGATVLDVDGPPEDLDVGGPLLVPGLGAQGGGPDDLRRLAAATTSPVLPATSRAVLAAGPSVAGLRAAAGRARDAYATALARTPRQSLGGPSLPGRGPRR